MKSPLFSLLFVAGATVSLWAQTPVISTADSLKIDSLETILLDGFYSGKYQETGELAEASLPYIGQVYGIEDNAYGNWMDMIGVFWNHAGDLQRALTFLEQTVAHARTYLGVEHEDYITRLSNLAMLQLDLGNSGLALAQLTEAHELGQANLTEDNLYFGIVVNNLALVYEAIGMNQEALRYYFRALELTELVYGKTHVRYATRLNNIASIYRQLGDYAKADEMYQQSEVIYAAELEETHAAYLNCLTNRGRNYEYWGKDNLALSYFEKVQRLLPVDLGDTHHYYFQGLLNLVGIQLKMSKPTRAKQYLVEAREKGAVFFAENRRWALRLALVSANCAEQEGDMTAAAGYYQTVKQIFQEDAQKQFDWLSQSDQQAFLAEYGEVLARMSSFAFKQRENEEILVSSFEMNRQLKELTLGYQRYLLKTLHEETEDRWLVEQFENWQDLRKNIAQAYSNQSIMTADERAGLERQANILERELAASSTIFREACQVSSWQELRQELGEEEAIIEFSFFNFQPQGKSTDSTYYVAYVLRKRAPFLEMVPLFEAGQLPNLRKLIQLYQPAQTDADACLQNLIAQPLLNKLVGIKTIYFSPMGLLHRINFGAIPISDTETFSQRYELHQVGAIRQLEREVTTTDLTRPARALVYGGIVYDEVATPHTTGQGSDSEPSSVLEPETLRFRSVANPQNNAWSYLPFSEQEAEEVSQRLRESGIRVHLAKETAATEEDFVHNSTAGPSPNFIHLATHGYFFPEPKSSDERAFRAAAEPMIRSGVVLAGANRAWLGKDLPAGAEDGILTAYEISLLDLSNTELVVLSACDTGLGELRDNEGVFGLQRAFKIAGADYLIMSLWSVPDRQTQEFMSMFYEQWLGQGQDIPTAFYQTQQLLKTKHAKDPSPVSWAGFVLVE